MPSAPDTVVLIHGFWVTPRSWEHWIPYLEGKGFRVLAPAYPGFEVEVEALDADPTPIAEVTVPAILDHLEAVVDELDAPPILIGHSAGGLMTQLLLARGRGAVGVALNSVPPEGVLAAPPTQLRSILPILKSPANRHRAVGFTHEQWHYAFTNGVDEELSRETYERYHVPASGHLLFDQILANVKPGHQATWLDFDADRPPLLLISGSEDHIMPASVQRANAKKYADDLVTEVEEVPGPHFMPGLPGWEAIADRAIEWAVAHARRPAAA